MSVGGARVTASPLLLVDDAPANLLALRAVLEDLEVDLVEARSGEEALKHVMEREFAVILLDVQMSGLDGYETAKLIRGREKSQHTPIIFLTAYESNRLTVADAYKLGAVDYLVKPLQPEILKAKVAAFVDLFQKTEQIKLQAEQIRRLERREFDRATQDLLTELREADRRKDEFLAMLAHELRGPLAPLGHMLEVMNRAGGNSDLIQDALGTMQRQLAQLVRLVDDLFDVSRIARGKLELRKERVEVAAVVQQAVETCRPLVQCARHEITVTLPPEPIHLQADPARLAQVFGNLLNNACKYTEPGGHISLVVERQGSDVLVKIKDTGVGIPPEKLPSIFEMYMQVDRSSERSRDGLGIGLTLVKRLVEMHEGTVEPFSEGPGRGSEFVVRLPILIESSAVQRAEPVRKEPATATPRRILIVDDNRDSALSLAMLLKLTGHETHTAYDGLEAIAAAEQFQPDIVLLDIGLPKLNGHEVARRIREQPWGKDMALVALTGWGQEEDRRKSKDAGFDHHMIKPVDHAALIKLLAERQASVA